MGGFDETLSVSVLIWIRWSLSGCVPACIQQPNIVNEMNICSTGWQIPMRCLIFVGHFRQKSPVIRGSFAKRDLQFKASYASSPPCTPPLMCFDVMWVIHVRTSRHKPTQMHIHRHSALWNWRCTACRHLGIAAA